MLNKTDAAQSSNDKEESSFKVSNSDKIAKNNSHNISNASNASNIVIYSNPPTIQPQTKVSHKKLVTENLKKLSLQTKATILRSQLELFQF